MYKSLKNFAWCIDFQKVNFEKDEEFDENKAKHKEIIEEMISHGYAEKISPEKKEKVLQDMTKVELIKFAQENLMFLSLEIRKKSSLRLKNLKKSLELKTMKNN